MTIEVRSPPRLPHESPEADILAIEEWMKEVFLTLQAISTELASLDARVTALEP